MAAPRRENSVVDALVDELRHDIMTEKATSGTEDRPGRVGRANGSQPDARAVGARALGNRGLCPTCRAPGANIIDVTITHVEDVLATRLVLDAVLGRVAASNLDREDLDYLHSLLVQIEAVKLPEGHAEIVDPAQHFHTRLDEAAGAPMMSRLVMQSVHHTNVFLSGMWFTNRRIAYVGKAYFSELYKALEAKDLDRVEGLIREWRVDMAAVILQDRVRTDELRILPSVLTPSELRRLRAIIDDGYDLQGPNGELLGVGEGAAKQAQGKGAAPATPGRSRRRSSVTARA